MSNVVNRIAVIAPSLDAFFGLMKNYNISMISKARKKFWTNKGATEYLFLEGGPICSPPPNEVIMLSGCEDKVGLYLDVCAAIRAPIQLTEAEMEAEAAVEDALIKINEAETSHD